MEDRSGLPIVPRRKRPRRRRIASSVAYDGSAFHGFQRQPGQRTVEGELIRCLQAMGLTGGLAFASRTDTGVHARGQVICFNVEAGDTLTSVSERLGSLLPGDIRLGRVAWAPPHFHPRWSAVGKRYLYVLTAPPPRDMLEAAFDELRRAPVLTGFTAAGAPLRTMPPLTRLATEGTGDELRLVIEGPAFARYAVRHLVGCAVAQATGVLAPGACAAAAISSGPWRGPRAPADGLTLDRVFYPPALDPFPQVE